MILFFFFLFEGGVAGEGGFVVGFLFGFFLGFFLFFFFKKKGVMGGCWGDWGGFFFFVFCF